MTTDEKVKQLKIYWETMWNYIHEGDYIDAIDSVNKWCLATIVEKDDNNVRVHFDGWSSKWDVNYRLTSYKIAPFRKYSHGYSGQFRMPLRQNITFTPEWLEEQITQINKVIESDFECMNARDITQYLRGQFFISCDFLMSNGNYT
jgi:hypothetical protein